MMVDVYGLYGYVDFEQNQVELMKTNIIGISALSFKGGAVSIFSKSECSSERRMPPFWWEYLVIWLGNTHQHEPTCIFSRTIFSLEDILLHNHYNEMGLLHNMFNPFDFNSYNEMLYYLISPTIGKTHHLGVSKNNGKTPNHQFCS